MRQAGDKVEITPEMIEAGACEIASYSPESSNSQTTAVEVYLAMEKVRCLLPQKRLRDVIT